MDPLKKRLILSFVFVTITVYAIFFAPAAIFALVIMAFAITGLNEFLDLAAKKGLTVRRPLTLILGVLLSLSMYFSAEPLLLVIACLAFFILHFNRDLQGKAFLSTAVMIFGLIYVVWFFSYLIKIRMLPYGAQWVFYTALIIKGGDAGAYFVGRKLGKRKLIEHISPKKSVEGAIGGLATTVVLSLISATYLPDVPLWHLWIVGLIAGVFSQLGDLAESLLKREAEVKDSGAIPGLGGILDVLDSLLLTIPLIYYYIVHLSGTVG